MKYLLAAVAAVALVVGGMRLSSATTETQRVLFIGNSYTATHDLPGRVAAITEANGLRLETTTIAPGGRTLRQHAGDSGVRSAIANGDYDLIVIQEQSEHPADATLLTTSSIPAAETLGELAALVESEVILFQTWGHRDGNAFTGHRSYSSMQSALVDGYWQLAEASGGRVAPVGSTWARSLEANDIALHSSDGSHPSPAGTHLASLVIARTILGERLEQIPADGVSDADAAALAALLW